MEQAAIVFPGQGSQHVGMGRDVHDTSPSAKAVFERANDILGFDLAKLCFEGPSDELERTDNQQPAIFVTSVALWEAFLEGGGTLDAFARAGGLSLGEYTALHVAGAMPFDAALRLVHRRGCLMQEAALAAPSGMVSLIGADPEIADAVCDHARGDDVLAPANFNCPGQIVISGSRQACDRAVAIATDLGCRAVALQVAGAFHSPLMASAAEGLWAALAEADITEPSLPVVANVDAEYHGDPARIRASLRRQVTEPVLWQRCVERMRSDGVERFYEIGPGRILTGLLRRIDRSAKAVTVNSAATLQAVFPAASLD